MLAMQIKEGNTEIEIWDDYVIEKPELVQNILDKVGEIAARACVNKDSESLKVAQ